MNRIERLLITLILAAMLMVPISTDAVGTDADSSERMEIVTKFIEDTFRYCRYSVPGSLYPHLFINGYSVDTKKPVEWKYKGGTYYPSNIISQQNFLRVLVGLTNLTGDPKYREVAEEQVKFWFDNFTDKNGLLYAGEHSLLDVKTGKILSYYEHELKQVFPYWEFMYEVAPAGVRRYLDACWNSHIKDWSNLSMNRHGYYDLPRSNMWDSEYTDDSIDFDNGKYLAFQNAGDDMINFAFFISEKTGEKGPELWARRMLQKFMDTVNPDTGLSGAQYGEMTGGDRLFLQYGPEFGQLAKEYNYINKYKIKTIAGFVPLYLLPYVERTGDTEVLDYIVKSVEGTAKHVYDYKANNLKTPMWSDGTNLQGYVRKRAGYQGVAGSTFTTGGERLFSVVLQGAVQTYIASKSEIIWDFARDVAEGFGLGDIGTDLGENVNLNMSTDATDTELVFTLIDLYRETSVKDYLDLAERIGDNIIVKHNIMMAGKSDLSYISIDSMEMLTLLRIEAAVRGDFGAVDFGLSDPGVVEFDFDGVARTTDDVQFWSKKRVPIEEILIDDSDIVLAINSSNITNFEDIKGNSAEDDIKKLCHIGAVTGVSAESFAPDKPITRAELATITVKLCGFKKRSRPFHIYEDVSDNAWYRNTVEMARNNGLIDDHLVKDGRFYPDSPITMEEMISIIVRALKTVDKETEYKGNGASNKLNNKDSIPEWARDYIDIACNYGILNDTNVTLDVYATRAEAVSMLMRLNDIIEKDCKEVTATILPSNATKKNLTWSSSDESVFIVDEKGRLYPVAVGSATLTAEMDGISGSHTIQVVEREDWMLKYVKINGVMMEQFVPNQREYDVNLLLGIKEAPKIEAQSYSGETVSVQLPKTLPGNAILSVGESEEKYTINITADRIDYKIKDDFEGYLFDRGLHNMWSGDTLWHFNSQAWEKGDASVRVRYRPDSEENNKCLIMPYHKGVDVYISGKFEDKPYIVGANADDNLIVFDFDLMVTAPINTLDVRIGADAWPVKLSYSNEGIKVYADGALLNLGEYTPGKFDNIKIVMNKKAMTIDWYLNGTKVLERRSALNVGFYEKLTRFYFGIPVTSNSEYGAKAYIDNIKLYELPAEYAELITK